MIKKMGELSSDDHRIGGQVLHQIGFDRLNIINETGDSSFFAAIAQQVIKNITQADNEQTQNCTVDDNTRVGELVFKIKRVYDLKVKRDQCNPGGNHHAKLDDYLKA